MSIEIQAELDRIRDQIDILEEDYALTKNKRTRIRINELYDQLTLVENSAEAF